MSEKQRLHIGDKFKIDHQSLLEHDRRPPDSRDENLIFEVLDVIPQTSGRVIGYDHPGTGAYGLIHESWTIKQEVK